MYKLLNMNLQETIRRILREELHSPAGDKYEPGRYVVHKSAPHWRDNIQLTGLQTSVGDCYQIYVGGDVKCKKAIFATDSLDEKDMFHSTYDDVIHNATIVLIFKFKVFKIHIHHFNLFRFNV